jgi:ketose-bisphosphate aldolase
MILPFRELLAECRARASALGAFTCYDATTACGVVLAAEARDVPAVLLLSERSFRDRTGPLLATALLAIARHARIGACVQLDHVSDVGLIRSAIALGVGAVMADGSRLPFRDNLRFVQEAVALASEQGAEVEAELGHVAGNEDVAEATRSDALTNPDEAAVLIGQTGASCLAVSIGNVHGAYARPPRLDWARLAEIHARTDAPLSLHGASGLSDDDLRRAVALGVRKVNVNTEIRERIYRELAHRVPETSAGYSLAELDRALVDAVADVVDRKLEVLSRPLET